MRLLTLVGAAAIGIAALLQQAVADPLPAGSIPATPGDLSSMYVGKTQSWRDKVGGYYFAPDKSVTALAKDTVYAYGTWEIAKGGRFCVNVVWRWDKDPKARSNEASCWAHVKVGKDIWKQYTADGEWYEWTGNESTLFTKGDKYAAQVEKLRAAYGP